MCAGKGGGWRAEQRPPEFGFWVCCGIKNEKRPGMAISWRFFRRLLQRSLILALGIFCVWLIVFVVFEFADQRLPWMLALGVTYGIAAYIILPRAVRMGLKILQRKSVPRFTITGDGLPGDPVNLALTGTLQQLRAAFATAGWSEADRLGWKSSWRMVRAFVFKSSYPTAPFSTLYLFGRAAKTSDP